MIKNKKLFIINIISLMLIVGMDIVYMLFHNLGDLENILIKSTTSGLFVVTGIINYIFAIKVGFKEKRFSRFAICMLMGLVFAMLGDIALEYKFDIGAGLFALGHVMFLISYICLKKINWKDIMFASIIIALVMLLIFLYDSFRFSTFDLIVVVVYAIIISCMLGKSVGNMFDKNQSRFAKLWIFIGSLFFFLSDLFLLFAFFARLGKIFSILCLSFYYPAEWILATSIYYSSRETSKLINKKDLNAKQLDVV